MIASRFPCNPVVRNLRAHRNGWMWEVEGVDAPSGEGICITYRTSGHGEGIWEIGSADEKQVVGTTQFHTSANRESARRQIRRFFEEGL